jgi:hypothetical protein
MSPPRRFSGKVKDGMGDSGTEGQDFTKRHRVDPWDSNPAGNYKSPRGAGVYEEKNADFLRDTGTDPENYAKVDVFDMVESQSDKTGPVKLRKEDR